MRVCIAGKNEIAVKASQFVAARYPTCELIGCKNSLDDGIDGWQPSFARFCTGKGIPLLSLEAVEQVDGLIFISLEYDRLLSPPAFRSDRLFNLHFSHLPAYKGMYTSSLPILFGERFTGVTFHWIDSGIDTGDIVAQRQFPITRNMTARDLYLAYMREGFELFCECIDEVISGRTARVPQCPDGSSYYSRYSLDYTKLSIDTNATAQQIHNQIRALSFREYQLPTILGQKIYKSEIRAIRATGKPGTVVCQDDFTVVINTIDYQVRAFCDQESALFKAAERGDIACFCRIQASGYPVTIRDQWGRDALSVALSHGQAEFAEHLLANGWESAGGSNDCTVVPLPARRQVYESKAAGCCAARERGIRDS